MGGQIDTFLDRVKAYNFVIQLKNLSDSAFVIANLQDSVGKQSKEAQIDWSNTIVYVPTYFRLSISPFSLGSTSVASRPTPSAKNGVRKFLSETIKSILAKISLPFTKEHEVDRAIFRQYEFRCKFRIEVFTNESKGSPRMVTNSPALIQRPA